MQLFMQSAQNYCQISIKPEEVAKLVSLNARVCKFIWSNAKPSHFRFCRNSPNGPGTPHSQGL